MMIERLQAIQFPVLNPSQTFTKRIKVVEL